MKKACFKENLMINCNIVFKKISLCFVIFCICVVCYANDFTKFPQDDDITQLSTTQSQTNTIVSNDSSPKKISATQLSLLRNANRERNGIYAMLAVNMIPISHIFKNKTLSTYSMGMGIRAGTISYLDENIVIRGYFALDFTNDSLSFLRTNYNLYNGTFLMASLGLDIMIDFFITKNYKNTLGFFCGVGAGAYVYFDTKTSNLGATPNKLYYQATANAIVQAGLSAVIAYHHRLEFGFRLLPIQSLSMNDFVSNYNPYLAYSYKFK